MAQSLCGRLVAAGAESPGDLVFWDYRDNAPTRVGIVEETGPVSAGRARAVDVLVVSWDPGSDRLIQLPMPSGWDVRVKRMLGGAA
ncbi:hypothetical protein ACFVUS_27220 [Nocardia sp. NPDC058058]|uniref:hypothetical protein n=1 Tax=Nocardia sp. NPDC058058 TaxID=3346317 RepID=UPI0036DC2DC4